VRGPVVGYTNVGTEAEKTDNVDREADEKKRATTPAVWHKKCVEENADHFYQTSECENVFNIKALS
jgi:hypothetical protein